jgi:hypothetical protein
MNTPDSTQPAELAIETAQQIEAPIGPDSVELGPWQHRLILFQRIAGGFMILKGLIHWGVLFSGAAFDALPMEARAATVFFAVIDLIAGVALWLGSPWGAAVWLMAVLSQIVAAGIFLDLGSMTLTLTGAEIALVLFFIVLRIKAHGEEQRYR